MLARHKLNRADSRPVWTALAAFLVIIASLGSAAAQSDRGKTDLITRMSAGPVRIGMTVAETRRVLPDCTISRTSDGEGMAFIDVTRNRESLIRLFAGEDDPSGRINERARIELIEVWSPKYVTSDGVHPGMLLKEVELRYGKLTQIELTEIESREYAQFIGLPPGITVRVEEGSGIYPEGKTTTRRYHRSARVLSIVIERRR